MLTIKPFPILAAVLAAFATSALAQSDDHGNGHAHSTGISTGTDGSPATRTPPAATPGSKPMAAKWATASRQKRVCNGHWEAWVRQIGRWQKIPDEKIIKQPNSSIFDAYLCWTTWCGTICFVPPDTGG